MTKTIGVEEAYFDEVLQSRADAWDELHALRETGKKLATALRPFEGPGHAYGYDDCRYCKARAALREWEKRTDWIADPEHHDPHREGLK